MEEQEARGNEHDQAAKAQLVLLMQEGYPWHEAVAATGLHMSRSTAYRLVQAVQTQGEAALQDKRQGHPAKLREAVLQWLVVTCRAAPQVPSHEVQAALQEQFGIHVSIGHLNRVRSQLGIGNHIGHRKKKAERQTWVDRRCSLKGKGGYIHTTGEGQWHDEPRVLKRRMRRH